MPEKEESTLHSSGPDVDLETSGPYREELDPAINKEVAGKDASGTPRRGGSLGEKDATSTQEANPKRTENSRPD